MDKARSTVDAISDSTSPPTLLPVLLLLLLLPSEADICTDIPGRACVG